MKEITEKILDYEPNQGPHFKHNRYLSILRFGLSGLIIGNMVSTLIREMKRDYSGLDAAAYYLGAMVPMIIYGWFVYYNVRQAIMEKKGAHIYPVFRKSILVIFLLVTILILIFNLSIINHGSLSTIFIVVSCVIILKRELVYYHLLVNKVLRK